MYIRSAALSLLLVGATTAFTPTQTHLAKPLTTLSAEKSNNDRDIIQDAKNSAAAFALATTIFSGSAIAGQPAVANALDQVEISSGAFVINTNAQTDSLLKAQIDTKGLIGTLFSNRQALTKSVSKIQSTVVEELNSKPWNDVKKAVLQFEGDVAPEVSLTPPNDWQQTIKDIRAGKLNFLLNGEIVNLSVDETLSAEEDEIVIRIRGFKGADLTTSGQEVAKGYLEEKIDNFWTFWQTPIESDLLPEDVTLDNGGAILAGGAVGITALYAGSYAYYLSEQEKEAAAAAAKREAMAAKRAAAEKKKKEAEAKKAAEAAAAEEATEEEKPEESKPDDSDDDKKEGGSKFNFWKK